jgi:hypothetical protein
MQTYITIHLILGFIATCAVFNYERKRIINYGEFKILDIVNFAIVAALSFALGPIAFIFALASIVELIQDCNFTIWKRK